MVVCAAAGCQAKEASAILATKSDFQNLPRVPIGATTIFMGVWVWRFGD